LQVVILAAAVVLISFGAYEGYEKLLGYSSTSALMPPAGYLENILNTMMPHTRIDIPIPIIIEPLTVQPGLLYINEEDGPTMDLLCSVNIIPRIVNIRPTTINDLLADFFRFINYRPKIHQYSKRYPHVTMR
jgi:hypothetical protein